MQKGQHIGKIIVNLPSSLDDLPTEVNSNLSLRSDSSYLLIGGLGGLGRAVSMWMVERGAKHLIYLSRSAGKSENDRIFMHELHLQGCSTQAFAGDVADPLVVQNVVGCAARPISGVIQMSMVLKVNLTFPLELISLLIPLGPRIPPDEPRRLASIYRS